MFNSLNRFFIEKVKAQRILVGFDFSEQSMAEERPFLLPDLTFEDGFLHTYAIIFASLSHAAEAAQAGLFDSGDIVSNEDQHGGLFGYQRHIVEYVAPKMASQDAGLDKGKLGDTEVLVQQRMIEAFLFPFLIGLYYALAANVGELHGSALPFRKVAWVDLLPVDKSDGEPVRQPGSKFFHKVEGERGAVRSIHVQISDERVKTSGGESSNAIVTQEGVQKG